MESDFSDFNNGSCSSPVEHLVEAQGCKEFNSPPSHKEFIEWAMKWQEIDGGIITTCSSTCYGILDKAL